MLPRVTTAPPSRARPGAAGDRKLSIGLIASARHPIREPFAGGLESQTHALATAMRKRGHTVRVFASAESDPALGFEPVCPPGLGLNLSDASREDESMPAESFLEEHHAYLSLMMRLRDASLDVIHNNSLHYMPIAMAEVLPCPLLTTLHTPPTPWIESAAKSVAGRPNLHWVAVSHVTAEHWDPILAAGVIHNGVDTRRWRPATGDEQAERVAWTGRIVPEKGPHHALRAAKRAGLPCVIAGPVGDETYFRELVQPELDDQRTFAGHLDRASLRDLVAGSAVAAVTPCWEEPFGLVIAEALACGTPVAAWDRGAVGELLPESCGRIARAGDVDDLARAIRAAIAEVHRPECRRHAEARLGLDRMIDQYEELFARLT